MFKINSEKELITLLRLVSKEAVDVSRRSLRESKDTYVEDFMSQYQEDEKIFGSLSEQEEEAEAEGEEEEAEGEEEEAEGEEEEAEGEEEADEGEEEAEEEVEEDEPESSAAFGASFDSVLTAINALRAGRSLKDDSIKSATSSYYDSLSQEEREVLLLFLKSLSEILGGGEETMDPSEDPYNYVISKGGEEEEEAEGEEEADEGEEEPEEEELEGEEEPEEEELEGEEEEEAEGEDTSPPIKVNESQDFTAIRRKIRRVMLKG